jgi:hypothetical protein
MGNPICFPRSLRPLRHLLALLPLLLALASTAATAAQEPDYTDLQALLKRYIRVLPVAKGEPWDARFDYEQLFIDDKVWVYKRSASLAALHAQLLAVPLSQLTPRQRVAWAINTNNVLVIERMVVHLLVPGRRFMRVDSPQYLFDDSGSFFGAIVANLDGRDYSIIGFARRFAYGDTTADPLADGSVARELPGDPRLLFALHRAALHSGPLSPWVYRADSLDAQLDRAARIGLALPRYLRAVPEDGLLFASNRFYDERADFGGATLSGIVPFAMRYLPAATRRMIQARKLTRPTQFFEPDWKLDQYDHPPAVIPGKVDADSSFQH